MLLRLTRGKSALLITHRLLGMEKLDGVLSETNLVTIVREIDRYPNPLELVRLVRAHAPQVVFLNARRDPLPE